MPRKLMNVEHLMFGEVRVRPADGTFYADASKVKDLLIAVEGLARHELMSNEPCKWCERAGYHTGDCPLLAVYQAAEKTEMEEWCGPTIDLVKQLWAQELLGPTPAGDVHDSLADTLYELQRWCVDKRHALRNGQGLAECHKCKRQDASDVGWQDDVGNLWCDDCVREKLGWG